MKNPTAKQTILSLVLLGCLICITTCFAVFAAQSESKIPGVSVIPNPDPDLLTGQIEIAADLFNTPEVFWLCNREDVSLLSSDTLPFGGIGVLEGSRSLLLTDPSAASKGSLTLRRIFEDVPLDCTQSRHFTLSLCLPEDTSCEVILKIDSSVVVSEQSGQRLSYQKTASLSKTGWNTLVFDISTFLGRTSVQEIAITLKYVRTVSPTEPAPLSFALDAVGFSSSASPTAALCFLSDFYTSSGCSVSLGQTMTVSAAQRAVSFTASGMPTLHANWETALCVTMINRAGFRTMRCSYTDAKTGAIRQEAKSLDASNDIQYLYFPLRADAVSGVSFYLEGSTRGTVEILSIRPVSFTVSPNEALGTLESCELDRTGKALVLSGTLNKTTLTQYRNSQLRVFELGLHQDLNDLIAGQCEVVASTSVSLQFSCEIPIASSQDLLTKGYAVALVTSSKLLPISEPIYPQASLPSGDGIPKIPAASGKKGYADLLRTDVFDGISHTAIQVRLEELLTLDQTSLSYQTNGTSYYYREEALRALDEQIALCRDRGIRATLILTASASPDARLNRILLHPSADPAAPYCAFNTTSQESVRYLSAAVDMLARRYLPSKGDLGGLVGFSVGQNVNNTGDCYSMGATTPERFVSAYAVALRTVYHAAIAVNPALSVYASFDCGWNEGILRGTGTRFPVRQSLDLLNQIITAQGDFPWQLAFDPYPGGDYYAFEDDTPLTSEAGRITLANLEVLTAYLTKPEFYCNRQYRSILLLEQVSVLKSTDREEKDPVKQGADYVYGYYKISTRNFALVRALIVNHDVSYNGTLCYIDTEHAAAATSYALKVLNIKSWEERLTAFDPAEVLTRSLTTNDLTHTPPSSVIGEITLWEFSDRGPTGGWTAGPGVSSVSPGTQVDSSYYLSVHTEKSPFAKDHREISVHFTSAYDFSLTPYLRFVCNVFGLEQGASAPELTVAVYSGSSCLRASTTLVSGSLTPIVVDMTSFSGIDSVDCIRIILHTEGEHPIGTPTLLVGKITGLSDQYHGAELEDKFNEAQNNGSSDTASPSPRSTKTVVILLTVILCAAALEILSLLVRRRRAQNFSKSEKISR